MSIDDGSGGWFPRGRWRTSRRATLLAVLLVVAVAGAAVGILGDEETDDEGPSTVVGPHDSVLLDMRIYDDEGRLLVSTDPADVQTMEEVADGWSDGRYRVPGPDDLDRLSHPVDRPVEPIPLGGAAAAADLHDLVGKSVGYQLAAPVVGQLTYEDEHVVNRTRGPFNATMRIQPGNLDSIVSERTGDEVVVDGLFNATVVEETDDVVRIRLHVEDGDVLPVRGADDVDAVVQREPGADRFWLRLHAEEGGRFTSTQGCDVGNYVLPSGTYRVTEVNTSHITFHGNSQTWPQLLNRDLVATLEIVDVAETPGGLDRGHGGATSPSG